MKRRPLSMKRLHVMAAEFLIFMGSEKGMDAQQTLIDFLKYIWEHKDEDLIGMPFFEAEQEILKSSPTK